VIKVEGSCAAVLNEGLAQPNYIDIAYDLSEMDRGIPHRQIGLIGIYPRAPHGLGTMHDQRRHSRFHRKLGPGQRPRVPRMWWHSLVRRHELCTRTFSIGSCRVGAALCLAAAKARADPNSMDSHQVLPEDFKDNTGLRFGGRPS
jgi:hypothetical protein